MKQTDLDRISTRRLNRLRHRILRVYGTARRETKKKMQRLGLDFKVATKWIPMVYQATTK